ncbi:MAG: hypothetical protein IJL61_04270 [Bacteroidales bacterium]|nr:hypothetical protein [Bacteroidales bacterium]
MSGTGKISLEVLSPEKTLAKKEVDCVFLPGSAGAFEVLYNHAPLVSSLTKGEIRWRTGEKEDSVKISSGFVEVFDNKVVACVEE